MSSLSPEDALDVGLSPVPKEGTPPYFSTNALRCEEFREAWVTSEMNAEELIGKLADAEAARDIAVQEAEHGQQELRAALAAARAELQAAQAGLTQSSDEAARLRTEYQDCQEPRNAGDHLAEIAALRQQLQDRDQALAEERVALSTEARALSEEALDLHARHEESLAQHNRMYSDFISEVAAAQQSFELQRVSPRHLAIAQSASGRQLVQPQAVHQHLALSSAVSSTGAVPSSAPCSPLASLCSASAHPQGGGRSSPMGVDSLRRTPKGAMLAQAGAFGRAHDGMAPISPREGSVPYEDANVQRLQALEASNQRLRAMQQNMAVGRSESVLSATGAVPSVPVLGSEPVVVQLSQPGRVATAWPPQAQTQTMGGQIGWR